MLRVSLQAARDTPGPPYSAPPWPRPAAELDRDRDGLITVQELQTALQECNIRWGRGGAPGAAVGVWGCRELGCSRDSRLAAAPFG